MKRTYFFKVGGVALVCVLSAAAAVAQETRAEYVSEARDAEAQERSAISPRPSVFERSVTWVEKKLDSNTGPRDGIYPEFGGLIPGSGWLTAGAGYRHRLGGGTSFFNTSASGSERGYFAAQSTVAWPRLSAGRLTVATQVSYQDFPQVSFFGIGRDAPQSARSNYRLRQAGAIASAAVHARPWLAIGGRVGYLRGPAIGPGSSSAYPSTTDRFDEESAPGLTSPVNFAHTEAFVEADTRDAPGRPTSGGFYRIGVSEYRDLADAGHGFSRVDLDATQYLPLFHGNSTLGVRSRVTLSRAADGHEIPFYLLPTLGGSNTLRGYSSYRFRDRNAALWSAEYRWPMLRMVDAAVFVDAGTVADDVRGLVHTRLASDYGFGLRAHSASRSFASVDVAKGREGVRVMVSMTAPFGASHHTVAPYVP